jgi:hypothetical protein
VQRSGLVKEAGRHYRTGAKPSQGPTVFPILFAAVVGRAAHAALLWRLEVGESLGVLDVLAGSTSLTSTVTSQIQLRKLSPLGLGLIVFWALSPVGGQASFRQMTIGTKTMSQPANFTYMVPHGVALNFGLQSHGGNEVNTLFLGAMLSKASIKKSPQDTWGNIKIPRIEHYENIAIADGEGWYDTKNGSEETYSSIIGAPAAGYESSDHIDYNFHMETMYFHLGCSVAANLSQPIPDGATNSSGWAGTIWWLHNSKQRARVAPDNLKPVEFTYTAYRGLPGDLRCTIETTYVELEIFCSDGLSCAAQNIRRSRLPHPPPAFT